MTIDHDHENRRAALGIMGWEEGFEYARPDSLTRNLIYKQNHGGWRFQGRWTPCADRNQAYEVLRRAEELGLCKRMILEKMWGDDWQKWAWAYLTLDPAIITKAVNDVFEERT